MFKQPSKALIREAEKLSDALALATAPLEGAAWELDSALSSIRKDAAGYRRTNAANATGGANYVEGELEAAVEWARKLNAALDTVRALVALRDAAA